MGLSDAWLKANHGKERAVLQERGDREGLSVRVTPKGKITFQLRYREERRALKARQEREARALEVRQKIQAQEVGRKEAALGKVEKRELAAFLRDQRTD